MPNVYHIDSFDTYQTTQKSLAWDYLFDSPAGSPLAIVGGGKHGNCLRMIPNSGGVGRGLGITGFETTTVAEGFWFKSALFGQAGGHVGILMSFLYNTTCQFDIGVLADGSIVARRGHAVLLGTSAAGVLTPNTWQFIEVKAYVHNAYGTITVRVGTSADDLVTVLSLANVDNQASAITAVVNRAYIGQDAWIVSGWDTTLPSLYFDDFYVANDFLGPGEVHVLRPSADDVALWSSSEATHHGAVSEATPDWNESYLTSQTAGSIDRFSHAGLLTVDEGTVHAIQLRAFAQQLDDGGDKSLFLQLVEGTSVDETEMALSAWYQLLRIIRRVTPAGRDLTIDLINTIRFGVRLG